MAPHPLDILSVEETNKARDIVKSLHPDHNLFFRDTYLDEPSKESLTQYLRAEHAGETPSPLPRQALAQYDVLDGKGGVRSHESIVDIDSGKRISHQIVPIDQQASLSV
jgi:primary-amine oxidase